MNSAPLRRRSPKRPRWENLATRWGCVDRACGCEFGRWVFDECRRPACDPHHILGRGWVGCDDPRNIVACCRICHDTADGCYKDGIVWSLYVKLKEKSLDVDFLTEGSRFQVRGRLEVWLERRELLRKFSEEMAREILR